MRICLLSPDRPSQGLNGPRRIAGELSIALASIGHDVHVIGYGAHEPRVEQEDGVWRHYVELDDRRLPGLRHCPVAIGLYAAVAKYQEVLSLDAANPVDLVVGSIWPGEGLVCLLDDRLPTVTVLVTPVKLMLDRGWLAGEPYETMARMERAVVERSDYIHSTTPAIAADVEKTFGLALPPSDAAPLFLVDRTGGSGLERYASPEQVEILFVGRPEPRKGADVLLAAARLLEHENPDTVFVLVGEGDWAGVCQDLETGPGLRERVVLLGAVDEPRLWRLYAGADIVCVPSRYESFGYALIEAMMFGKAVVASDAGGMPAIVEEGRNALVCPPGDAEALSRCLAQLVRNPDTRAAYGRRSRELYLERYATAPGAARTAALYKSIAADHRRDRAAATGMSAGALRLADALAAAVSEIARLDDADGSEVAAELLAGTSYPRDARTDVASEGWHQRAVEAERRNAKLQQTLDSVTRSRSWRLTEPLRRVRSRNRATRPKR